MKLSDRLAQNFLPSMPFVCIFIVPAFVAYTEEYQVLSKLCFFAIGLILTMLSVLIWVSIERKSIVKYIIDDINMTFSKNFDVKEILNHYKYHYSGKVYKTFMWLIARKEYSPACYGDTESVLLKKVKTKVKNFMPDRNLGFFPRVTPDAFLYIYAIVSYSSLSRMVYGFDTGPVPACDYELFSFCERHFLVQDNKEQQIMFKSLDKVMNTAFDDGFDKSLVPARKDGRSSSYVQIWSALCKGYSLIDFSYYNGDTSCSLDRMISHVENWRTQMKETENYAGKGSDRILRLIDDVCDLYISSIKEYFDGI